MKKIVSISLAIILLSSNLGFAMTTHYCGGLAVDSKLIFGHETLDCGMANMDKDHEATPLEGTHFTKKRCCENEFKSLNLEDDFKPTISQSHVSFEFVATFILSFLHLPLSSVNDELQYASYSPPLIDQDIPVLHQEFLI